MYIVQEANLEMIRAWIRDTEEVIATEFFFQKKKMWDKAKV